VIAYFNKKGISSINTLASKVLLEESLAYLLTEAKEEDTKKLVLEIYEPHL
jgi:hypothetical protein